ncbi:MULTISPECIES: glycosyltransferase family 4 protein [Cyanophyceae]|uniref:glycosyltransferase family 4 protein n=1 Tax=Cyanophyceae TaxID=3028117 RepID=UPI001683B5E6|nr:glycosyltransferase family 4 protein [Trichocoleus sp. FACHB-40]MBD2003880.1 glycosyltransferase family 4 protein [Trichocoleus sp. FACHB-40]
MKDVGKISLLVWNLSTNDGIMRASLLGEALLKLGYKVEILGFVFGKKLYGATPSRIPIYAVPVTSDNIDFKPVRDILQKIDGDVIYAIKPQPASFGVALLKKLYTRRPLIVDIDDWELSWHGGDEWHYRPTPKQLARDLLKKDGALRRPDHPLYLKLMERLISQADAVTVHTNFLKERFGGISVPNGKDISLFDPARYDPEESRVRYGLSGYRILMFPGAPRPYKGLEDVLMALDHLNEPDLRLVIVGGSPYDNYDDKLIEQWGRWIIKLPSYPAEVMPEIVAAAHIVVVPQRDTPATRAQFPLKLTDGMAMAKPVLATRVGDIPEILGGTGYLVEPSCPNQIAEKIQWMFQYLEEAQQQGKRARERCVESYSIGAMASILSQVIANL